MTVLRAAWVVAAALLAQGCVANTITLYVRPDGSGRATVTSRLYLDGMRAYDAIFAADAMAPRRPPQAEEELPAPTEARLGQEFGTPVKIASTRFVSLPDGGFRVTEIDIDDVRKIEMMFPPLTVSTTPGRNAFLALDGVREPPLMKVSIRPHENGDRLLVLKLPNPPVSKAPDDPVTVFETGSREERLFKDAIKHMSLRLFVEIEQPLLGTNAPRREGNRATILDLDLDRMLNALDETRARRVMAQGSFQEMLWHVGDLPGAIVPTETEIYLEYEGPQQPAAQAPPAAPAAPAPPDTEIYLAPLTKDNGRLSVGAPVNITNNPGYDNQPFFTLDGRAILFASVRGTPPAPAVRNNPAAAGTDVYRYDMASRSVVRVTETPESEYSPTPMLDGVRISAVTVEASGTQRLWSLKPGGPKVEREMMLPEMVPVGYHAWADERTVALFILSDGAAPATLQLVDTRSGRLHEIAADIGRSILRMPGDGPARHLSFVQRERSADRLTLVVKELDPVTRAVTTLTPAVEGSREADLAWTPDGTLLMVKDDVLYGWTRGQSGWTEVARLGEAGLKGVTRLAVSPKGDRLALVAPPQPR